jgi:hypothetical protein
MTIESITSGLEGYLATRDGMNHIGIENVTLVNGRTISAQTFIFAFDYYGRPKYVNIMAEPGISIAEVEDMADTATENYIKELDLQERKRLPTEQEKKDIGKILKDIDMNKRKRRLSSTNKLYFPGIH